MTNVHPLPTVPGGYTTYNPKPGEDPEWDAYVATYTNKLRKAQADADFAKSRLKSEYDLALGNLDAAAPQQRDNLESSLLSRGVGRSGEALRRHSDLESGFVQQKDTATRALLEGQATTDQQMQGAEADLAAEREGQIGLSRDRLAKRGLTGADTKPTTPGYTPPPKKKAPAPPKKPATPKPPVANQTYVPGVV